MADASNMDWLRHNGVHWINFGPAIISACNRIDLHIDNDEDYKITTERKNFSVMKDWVKSVFERKLNESPITPINKAEYEPIYLELFTNEQGVRQDVLLMIPLTSKMLDLDEIAFRSKLVELKSQMQKFKR